MTLLGRSVPQIVIPMALEVVRYGIPPTDFSHDIKSIGKLCHVYQSHVDCFCHILVVSRVGFNLRHWKYV